MSKSTVVLIAIVAIVGLFGLTLMSSYNGLVAEQEQVNGKWSQIDTMLQRRADLIPNLVESVKGYAAHETGAIQAVADARAKLGGAKSPEAASAANGELNGALSRLLVVVENYPNLKADANFRQLMDELAGTENRLAVARKDYNDVVQVYNAKVKTFPTMIIAGMMGFGPREYFKVEEAGKTAPKVNF